MEKKQNWEISFDMHLEKFRRIDPDEAALRANVEFDPVLSRFKIESLGHTLYAEWPEFKLKSAASIADDSADSADFIINDSKSCPKSLLSIQMQVLVMRVLYLGVYAPSTGAMKAYRELPWGDVYDINFNGRCIKRFAYGFGFNTDKFEKAAVLLGGTKLEKNIESSGNTMAPGISIPGDVSFDFEFFGGITCRFILWKPDEEFPPSAQILFSDNAPLLYNAEDLAAVGDVIISALKEVSK